MKSKTYPILAPGRPPRSGGKGIRRHVGAGLPISSFTLVLRRANSVRETEERIAGATAGDPLLQRSLCWRTASLSVLDARECGALEAGTSTRSPVRGFCPRRSAPERERDEPRQGDPLPERERPLRCPEAHSPHFANRPSRGKPSLRRGPKYPGSASSPPE